ncbi:MAG: carboxypeptidase-like regulatory domain-containing protein [Pseudobacter sp.]|uniref:carboxypeptidase-like regulatory domain-containing protein n=1 Tax=Pseudobacter sp. TaxID=2045420 RepID=UPI003F800DF3
MSNIKKFYLLCVLGLFSTHFVLAQNRNISGTVTDPQKCPIPGVSVTVRGTVNSTLTDINGKFYLIVPPREVILDFFMYGYINPAVALPPELSVIDVELEEEPPLIIIESLGILRFVPKFSPLCNKDQMNKAWPGKTGFVWCRD